MYELMILENPIGLLQELCVSYHWPLPQYHMVKDEGLPHEHIYTIACVVISYRETGELEVCVALGTVSTVYRRDVCRTYYL